MDCILEPGYALTGSVGATYRADRGVNVSGCPDMVSRPRAPVDDGPLQAEALCSSFRRRLHPDSKGLVLLTMRERALHLLQTAGLDQKTSRPSS